MEVECPIGRPVLKNIDGTMLEDSAFRLIDGILDNEGNFQNRPGLDLGARLSTGAAIDGQYWWDDIARVMLLSGGHLWVMNSDFSGADLGTTTNLLNTGTRPTFATDGTSIYIANGVQILKSNGANSNQTAYLTDTDAPTEVTHIVHIDGYLLANLVGTQKIYFSVVGDSSNWEALDYFSAESRPDVVVAIYEFQREIYIFGKISFEVWEDDGQTPFSRVPGGARAVGCIAPYSVVKTDNGVIWLSNTKKFVKFDGGAVQSIATPYDKEIQKFLVISDCVADRINILGKEFYTFSFISEGRTIVYNATDDNWGEWGYWNSSGGFHERFLGNAYCFSPDWNQHIWGTRKPDGAIYKMSPDYTDDHGDAIVMESISGHISYGTNNMKRNKHFTMRVKKGEVNNTSEPVITLSFNDDNKGWKKEKQISLGKKGEYKNTIKLPRTGIYRTRQYRFRVSDNVAFAFGHAREDIYDMGR